jgi:hypothetical protein
VRTKNVAVSVPLAVSFSFSLPITSLFTLITLPVSLTLAVDVTGTVIARRWGSGLAECAHGGIHG